MMIVSSSMRVVLVALAAFYATCAWATDGESATLKGNVTDLWGSPVPKAKAQLLSGGTVVAEAITDQSGSYYLTDLHPGTFSLRIACDWCDKMEVSIRLEPKEIATRSDAVLIQFPDIPLPTLHMRGVVKDSKGRPVKGATVCLVSPLKPELNARSITDEAGRYDLEIRWLGQFIAYAFKSSFLIESHMFAPSRPGRQPRVNFTLSPLANLYPDREKHR